MVYQSDQIMLESGQGEGVFPGFLPLMPERPQGALRKPTIFFWGCLAFSVRTHGDSSPFLERGSLGGHIPRLPAGHAVDKERESVEGQRLEAQVPGWQKIEPLGHTLQPLPETGLRSPPTPAPARHCMDLVLQMGGP